MTRLRDSRCEKQIPCGNDRKKSKGKGESKGKSKNKSGFFAALRMTRCEGSE
jgi:hypothetical protein